MEETWSIGELAERAADALRAQAQPVSGRVREVPSERIIRWYTTIGLVDPPLTRRGRIAQYGRRHLLQLVAIKRMQAQGQSIAEIQATLTGATDARLSQVAELAVPVGAKPEGPRARFWAERPNVDAEAHNGEGPVKAAASPPEEAASPMNARVVHGVRIADGVTVLLDGASRTPTAEDIEAVLAAAGPLLTVLEERRLA
ncbi:helix-turn-helix domain-containing protein [Nonomuraea sp. NPDC050556]|uniref:helix-turn-helix domain-containing protein n=1 Tax=Nonomuraea sp. NPDC050556 TaxID=3364369 RepID=UPI00378FFCD4